MSADFNVISLIQQSLTPVFLIVGIGTLLNTITSRLARIVDRVRFFDLPESEHLQHLKPLEIKALTRRMRYANWAVNFLSGAAVLVCINILMLVASRYVLINLDSMILITFMAALVSLALGMICFFIEVSIATRTLRVRC